MSSRRWAVLAVWLGACGAVPSSAPPSSAPPPVESPVVATEPERLEWVSLPIHLGFYAQEPPYLDRQNELVFEEVLRTLEAHDVRAVRVIREVAVGFSCANSYADYSREEGNALRAAQRQGPPYVITGWHYQALVGASLEVGERLKEHPGWTVTYMDDPSLEIGPAEVISTQRRVRFEVQVPAR